MHIAVAAGTNSLCVMWGGSFGRFIPYAPEFLPEGLFARAVYNRMDCFGCTGACSLPSVQGKLPCIATIPVSAVLSSLKEILRDDCATAVQSLPTSSPETTPPA
jgi:hypothetical protein